MYTFAWPGAKIIPEAPDPNAQGLCKYNRGIYALFGSGGGEFYFFYFLQTRNFRHQGGFSDLKPWGQGLGAWGVHPTCGEPSRSLPEPSESQLSPLLARHAHSTWLINTAPSGSQEEQGRLAPATCSHLPTCQEANEDPGSQ